MEQDAPGPSYIFLQQFQNHSFDLFLLNNNFRNQDLSLRNEVCSLLCGAMASIPLSWQTKEIYMCVIQFFFNFILFLNFT